MKSIFYDSQYGFQKTIFMIHSITELTGKVIKSNKERELIGALYTDLSKAFDTTNHDHILYKMNHYGI